jgi:hypothetical protein
MMGKKIQIAFERKVMVWRTVDVEDGVTPEEAIKRILGDDTMLTETKTLSLEPVAVSQPYDNEEDIYELDYDIVGRCAKCGNWITTREIPGQPWNYDNMCDHGGSKHDYDPICYRCAAPVVEQLAALADGDAPQ